jgi:predicted NBD/HSP70 family sugar kinase
LNAINAADRYFCSNSDENGAAHAAMIRAVTAGGGGPRGLRAFNRAQVLRSLGELGELSRAQLADATGLSRTTIHGLVRELRSDGAIDERVGRPVAGRRTGRPPAVLRLRPRSGAVVGVDLGHRHLRVAVADLGGRILGERAADARVDPSAHATLDLAAALVKRTLRESGVRRRTVSEAVLGLPGPVNHQAGTVAVVGRIMRDWSGVAPAQELGARIRLPVRLENDGNLGALGELAYGVANGANDFVYVKLATGIGAGLVLGGRLYRGNAGYAGEIGHVQVADNGMLCSCGSRGCLSTYASGSHLVDLLQPHHEQPLAVADIVELTRAGDPIARRVVSDAGRAVGRVLADLCNTMNPSTIVIGGILAGCGATLLDAVRESVNRYAQPLIAGDVNVVAGNLGERAEVLGAVALALDAKHALPAP